MISRDDASTFRVRFDRLAKVRRGDPVQVDPFLIARAVALVMRECTVRAASGRRLLWNEYRVILARRDFDLVRSLQGPLERDLTEVLAREADAREAELVGALRISVVFDEADELPAGAGVVRVAFVPTDKLATPRAGDLTVRLDGWAAAGEIAARAPAGPADTVFIDDSAAGPGPRHRLRWPGGEAAVVVGSTVVIGRPHAGAPPDFVALTGASPRINKQHAWIAVGTTTVRVGRFAGANPVQVNGAAVPAAGDVEAALPVEISLSRGELVLGVSR
jgi:hypothetical protein